MNRQQQQLMQSIQKFDIFHGFTFDELGQIIHVGALHTYEPNQQICKAGEPSTNVFILLRGQMMVLGPKGEPLGSVTAGGSIGEMGVFTGQPRTATVLATTESSGIVIRKLDLDALMTRYPAMFVKLLRNIIIILCRRLSATNELNAKHMQTILRLREQIEKA